jgi:hypothetical protein
VRETVLAILALIALLLGFMILAIVFSRQSGPLLNVNDMERCRAACPTSTPQVENDFTSNKFEQVTQRSEFEACVLAGPHALDCGKNRVRLGEDATNPDANWCAVNAFRTDKPFVFEEASSGIDTFSNLWTIGAPDGQVYFIADGYYLSIRQAITTTTFLCARPVVEESWFSSEVESIACKEGARLKEETVFPYAP